MRSISCRQLLADVAINPSAGQYDNNISPCAQFDSKLYSYWLALQYKFQFKRINIYWHDNNWSIIIIDEKITVYYWRDMSASKLSLTRYECSKIMNSEKRVQYNYYLRETSTEKLFLARHYAAKLLPWRNNCPCGASHTADLCSKSFLPMYIFSDLKECSSSPYGDLIFQTINPNFPICPSVQLK